MTLAQETAAAYAAFAAGRYGEAEERVQRVLRQQPQDPAAQTLLGRLALMAGEPDVAHDLFRSVLEQHSRHPAVWVDLALALRDLNHHENAREAMLKAVGLDARERTYWVRLGEICISLNDREKAAEAFKRALDLDPQSIGAFRGLSQVERLEADSSLVRRFDALSAKQQLSPSERAHLHYTLAQIFRRAGRSEEFIRHLFEANAQQRATCTSDARAQYQEMFDRVEAAFTAEAFELLGCAELVSPSPLFVLGMPRSGTTLVERILSAHPDVRAGGEIDYMRRVLRREVERRTQRPFPESFETLDRSALNDLAKPFGRRLQILGRGARCVTDKTPGNYHLLGLLRRLFPGGSIVHIERDPMDTCFSILQYPFDERAPHTCDIELLAYSYARYRRLMERWKRLFGAEYLTVRYEELVAAPSDNARRIYAHCRLEWRDEYLDPAFASAPVRTFSAMQVREPIYRSSVGAWQEYAVALEPLRKALERNYAALGG